MSSPINPTNSLNPSTGIDSAASTSASGRADASPAAGVPGAEQLPADTASLSKVSDLVAKAMEQPEVRMDKVEAIRSQIAAGTYEVDPSKIAEAVIKSMSE
jgi:flagellar biosynthesis anti-sigma factor FlgM